MAALAGPVDAAEDGGDVLQLQGVLAGVEDGACQQSALLVGPVADTS